VIPAENAHLNIASVSHPGMKGKNNEDRYRVTVFEVGGSQKGTPSVLAVVSDGIGGHRAGEVAAEMVVDIISRTVAASDPSDPPAVLRDSIIKASQVILSQAEVDPQKKGMGATCACAWVIGSRLYTASVGDSRIYLIRGEKIRKISTDHTWVQEAIELGLVEPEQARSHPNAHIIRRYLGSQQTVVPDLRLRINPDETEEESLSNQGVRLVSNDFLLLCSDGLTDLVDDAEILAAVKSKELDEAVEGMVNLANERGGHDNITIIALHVPRKPALAAGPAAPAAAAPRRLPLVPITLSCAGIGIFLALLVLLGGVAWYFSQPDLTPTITQTHEPFPTMTPTPGLETTLFPVIPQATPTRQVTPRPPDGLPAPRPSYTPWPTSTPALPAVTPPL
jgi:PPM family protein phosphatase